MKQKIINLEKYSLLLNFTISDERANILNEIKKYNKDTKLIHDVSKLFRSKSYKKDQFFKAALDHEWSAYLENLINDSDAKWQKTCLTTMIKNRVSLNFLIDKIDFSKEILKSLPSNDKLFPYMSYICTLGGGLETCTDLSFLGEEIEWVEGSKKKKFTIAKEFLFQNYFSKEDFKKIIQHIIDHKISTPEELIIHGFEHKIEIANIVSEMCTISFDKIEDCNKLSEILKRCGDAYYYDTAKIEPIITKILNCHSGSIVQGTQTMEPLWHYLNLNEKNISEMIDKYNIFEQIGRRTIFQEALIKELNVFFYFMDKVVQTYPKESILEIKKILPSLEFITKVKNKSNQLLLNDALHKENFSNNEIDFIKQNFKMVEPEKKKLYIEKLILKYDNDNQKNLKINKL